MNFKRIVLIIFITLILLGGVATFLYFRFFFTYEQKNKVKRQIETVVGMNLKVTVFDREGNIIKQWHGVKKITSGGTERSYTYFYTKENKYVQIPDSVWYIAEEE